MRGTWKPLAAMAAAAVLLGLVWGSFLSPRTLPPADARDARFKEAWLRFLREKAQDNPEAAATLAFWEDHPYARVHLASRQEMRRVRVAPGSTIKGAYISKSAAIVIVWFPWRPFVDPAGDLLPEDRLRPQLESAASVFVHETSHFRTDADLHFGPAGDLQSEILAFGHQRRYLRRALVLTPELARAGRARLEIASVSTEQLLGRDLQAAESGRQDEEAGRARHRIGAWHDWSAAAKKYGTETVFDAMLAVATPVELCRAVSSPHWYGAFDADVDSSSAAVRIKFAADPKRLAAARAYFHAQMPEIEGCITEL